MPNIIYAALEPYELYFPIPEIVMDKNVALRASYILRKDTIYTVVSKSPKLQIRYLRLATTKCPEELAQYC